VRRGGVGWRGVGGGGGGGRRIRWATIAHHLLLCRQRARKRQPPQASRAAGGAPATCLVRSPSGRSASLGDAPGPGRAPRPTTPEMWSSTPLAVNSISRNARRLSSVLGSPTLASWQGVCGRGRERGRGERGRSARRGAAAALAPRAGGWRRKQGPGWRSVARRPEGHTGCPVICCSGRSTHALAGGARALIGGLRAGQAGRRRGGAGSAPPAAGVRRGCVCSLGLQLLLSCAQPAAGRRASAHHGRRAGWPRGAVLRTKMPLPGATSAATVFSSSARLAAHAIWTIGAAGAGNELATSNAASRSSLRAIGRGLVAVMRALRIARTIKLQLDRKPAAGSMRRGFRFFSATLWTGELLRCHHCDLHHRFTINYVVRRPDGAGVSPVVLSSTSTPGAHPYPQRRKRVLICRLHPYFWSGRPAVPSERRRRRRLRGAHALAAPPLCGRARAAACAEAVNRSARVLLRWRTTRVRGRPDWGRAGARACGGHRRVPAGARPMRRPAPHAPLLSCQPLLSKHLRPSCRRVPRGRRRAHLAAV
jgi:hypothetical protein